MNIKRTHLLFISLLVCVVVLVIWQFTRFSTGNDTSKKTQQQVDQAVQSMVVSDLEVAGLLANILAQHSPLLSETEKQSISQDYFGASLESTPSIHTITVKRIVCEYNVLGNNSAASCAIDYGGENPVRVSGQDAITMYKVLALAGIEEVLSTNSGEELATISVYSLECIVDDTKVQTSPGNNIQGFSCTISTTQGVTKASEKIKRFQQCVFTQDGSDFYVSPCTVNAMNDGLVTIGVSEGSEPPANPFFYLSKGENGFESTATWNAGEPNHVRADVPLPGVWTYQDMCFFSENWKLCFPENISYLF